MGCGASAAFATGTTGDDDLDSIPADVTVLNRSHLPDRSSVAVRAGIPRPPRQPSSPRNASRGVGYSSGESSSNNPLPPLDTSLSIGNLSFGSAGAHGSVNFNLSLLSPGSAGSFRSIDRTRSPRRTVNRPSLFSLSGNQPRPVSESSSSASSAVNNDMFFRKLRMARWLDGQPEPPPQVRTGTTEDSPDAFAQSRTSFGQSLTSTELKSEPKTSPLRAQLTPAAQQFSPTNPLVTAVELPPGAFENYIEFRSTNAQTLKDNALMCRKLEFMRLSAATQHKVRETMEDSLVQDPPGHSGEQSKV